ncbi:hypothetical protein Tco_0783590 [Tanacetum coccineum]
MVVARGDVEGGDDGGEERVVVSAVGGNHGGGGVEAAGMWDVVVDVDVVGVTGVMVSGDWWCGSGCCGGGLAGIQPEYGGGAGKVREGRREARVCYKNEVTLIF